jgi:hypothetical protein
VRLVPSFLTRNTKLKLASLALAVLLWVAVRIDAPARQLVTGIQVAVALESSDWTMRGGPDPDVVTVEFAGTTRELLAVARDRPRIVIPIEDVHASDTTIPIAHDWVRSGDRAAGNVVRVDPLSVQLAFEAVESMTVPYRAQLTGTLPDGLALAGPVTTVPRMARLRGPLRLLGNRTDVTLEPFDLEGVTVSASYLVAIESGSVQGLSVSPDSVTLVIPVEDEMERVYGPLPVVVVGSSADASASPDSVSVRIRGARSLVERFDPTVLRVVATATPQIGDVGVLPLRIEGLPDLLEGEPEPSAVTVRLALDP